MSETRLPRGRPHHPATFLERGVAAPFTTPLLVGSRMRAVDKAPPELIIPNLYGGAGVYVMGWASTAALFTPTLHDRELYNQIAALQHLTPSTVRHASRAVEADGLAGEDAMEAAKRAADDEATDRQVVNHALLLRLAGQVDATTGAPGFAAGKGTAELERRSRLAVSRTAARLGRSADWVAAALENMANLLIEAGLSLPGTINRRSRLVERMRCCAGEIAEWSGAQHIDDREPLAEMICAFADLTLTLADAIIGQTRTLTEDVVGLLRIWAVDPQPFVRLATRLEWLLDGWDQVCVIWWLAGDDRARRAALAEMALLVPVLPEEVRERSDPGRNADIRPRLRRPAPTQDRRTGAAAFDLIARSERIRAATC